MRSTAERAVAEACGDDLRVLVLGNAPMGFYKRRYPLKLRSSTGLAGVKVFVYKAFYTEGKVEAREDFTWATREEMGVLEGRLQRVANKILYDESE